MDTSHLVEVYRAKNNPQAYMLRVILLTTSH